MTSFCLLQIAELSSGSVLNHLSALLSVFVVFSGTGGWRLETMKRSWKIKDMLCVWSTFLLLRNLNEILFNVISQICFNVLKKKTLFGLGCAWRA